MSTGDDWLLRPVLQGMCKYESLLDGTLCLYDIAVMNEAINVDNENRNRIEQALSGRK